jgi:hypothetical protein
MFQRFVERYQLWREERIAEREGSNPLFWFAAVAVLALAVDCYSLARHTLPWSSVLPAILLIAFLILYLRKSPIAWWFLPLWGILILVQIPFMSAHSEAARRAGIIFSFVFALWLIAYSFAIRRRYYSFLEGERSRAIDANI